MQARQNHCNF